MDEEKTFEVLDGFFSKHPKSLKKIDECEDAIQNCKDKFPARASDYQNQLEIYLQQLKNGVTEFYYNERKLLLKSLILIFIYDSCAGSNMLSPAGDMMKHLLTQNILKVLIDNLQQNIGKHPEKKRDNKEKQEFLLQKVEEEELLLQSIFCLLSEYHKDIKDVIALKIRLLQYFIDNTFVGYFYSRDPSTVVTQSFEKIYRKEAAIRDLSTFTALLCLSINVRAPEIDEDLGKLIKTVFACGKGTIEDLLKITAYIVGNAACKVKGTDVTQAKDLKQSNFKNAFEQSNSRSIVESLTGLMESHILREQEYEFIRGPLLNVLKLWIEKAGFIEVIPLLVHNEAIPLM